MSRRFQVDLRGVVDLLGRHLYSSPRVYVRELVQNGVDAVTALAALPGGRDPRDDRPAVQLVVRPGGVVECWDSGAGLTPAQIDDFLSTIGSSSKRDDLGFQRDDLLGQFGIGLLSGFMVSDRIELVSRAAGATGVVRWVGSSDGTYATSTPSRRNPLDADHQAWLDRGPGTCVRLTGRADDTWTTEHQVLDLARHYLSFLPHRVVVVGLDGEAREIAPSPPPWTGDPARAARELGIDPFATLELSVPEAGLDGVVVVSALPRAARAADHVYVRGMLVARDVALCPDWAVFARCVVNGTALRPTASREDLYDDDTTAAVRAQVAAQLMRWLRRLADTDPRRMAAFMEAHHVALSAAALHDPALRSLLVPLLPVESTVGVRPLGELCAAGALPSYVTSIDDYRQVAALARAQGLVVVAAGYVHLTELLRAWAGDPDGRALPEISPTDLAAHLDHVDDATEAGAAAFLGRAEEALAEVDVAVQLRRFAPHTVPALLLDDASAWRTREQRSVRDAATDDVFGALLAAVASEADARPRLLLNHDHPQVLRLLGPSASPGERLAVRATYVRALLAANRPVRPVDAALVDSTFAGLLDVLAQSSDLPDAPRGA